MDGAGDTCWTMIRAAGAGEKGSRDRFVSRYGPVVRAYFGDRWRTSPLRQEVEGTVQDVFLDCLREGGVLARADPARAAALAGRADRAVALCREMVDLFRRMARMPCLWTGEDLWSQACSLALTPEPASIRSAAEIEKLPEPLPAECRRRWAEVDSLIDWLGVL